MRAGHERCCGPSGPRSPRSCARPRKRSRSTWRRRTAPPTSSDEALPLTEEAEDEAVAAQLRERLGAIDRALARIEAGTYGRSVLSGQPIPDARLEADPAAELTVEEAKASR